MTGFLSRNKQSIITGVDHHRQDMSIHVDGSEKQQQSAVENNAAPRVVVAASPTLVPDTGRGEEEPVQQPLTTDQPLHSANNNNGTTVLGRQVSSCTVKHYCHLCLSS